MLMIPLAYSTWVTLRYFTAVMGSKPFTITVPAGLLHSLSRSWRWLWVCCVGALLDFFHLSVSLSTAENHPVKWTTSICQFDKWFPCLVTRRRVSDISETLCLLLYRVAFLAGTSGFGVESHQYEVRRFGGRTNFGVFIGFVDSKTNIQLNSRGLNILFVPNQSLASVLDRENKQKFPISTSPKHLVIWYHCEPCTRGLLYRKQNRDAFFRVSSAIWCVLVSSVCVQRRDWKQPKLSSHFINREEGKESSANRAGLFPSLLLIVTVAVTYYSSHTGFPLVGFCISLQSWVWPFHI